jgi:hypothetical protein
VTSSVLARAAMLFLGLPLALAGFGLIASFGIFAFVGMPLMVVGLGLVSAAVNPEP